MRFLHNLFGSKKPALDSLIFDSTGWLLRDHSTNHRAWEHPSAPAVLSVHFFALPPDLPRGLDLTNLRQQYRNSLIQNAGGLIEVSRGQVEALPLIRTLFKLPQSPSGMGYIGALTLPFREYSYVVKVQAQEDGMTGQRESVVAEKLFQTGTLHLTNEGFASWAADPYQPNFTAGALMNQSEQAAYDALFPEHPLTLVRQTLDWLETSLRLKTVLLNTPRF
ncbi:hypothetical protein [Hymenobacter perfusus]|uniref:Uncharacterized protein n=1 Tax=Hymenobacter perfusus TaxID=1236770 RepID=A0A3R9MQT8_9BACT|nr:hypothetical protein [Hymenobacter perfusus]RSK38414.1 hypothetical protein EI293_21590 [Hymenobacter perfusus]